MVTKEPTAPRSPGNHHPLSACKGLAALHHSYQWNKAHVALRVHVSHCAPKVRPRGSECRRLCPFHGCGLFHCVTRLRLVDFSLCGLALGWGVDGAAVDPNSHASAGVSPSARPPASGGIAAARHSPVSRRGAATRFPCGRLPPGRRGRRRRWLWSWLADRARPPASPLYGNAQASPRSDLARSPERRLCRHRQSP